MLGQFSTILWALLRVAGLLFAAVSERKPKAAAASSERPKALETVGYFNYGHGGAIPGKLKAILRRRGYPLPHKKPSLYGGGGYFRVGSWMVGGEGGGGGADIKKRHYVTHAGEGGGSGSLGYVVYEDETMRVYPMLAIGGGGGGVSVEDTRKEDRRPRKNWPAAGTGGPLLRFGVGFEYRLPVWGAVGLTVGLHAGLTITPLRLRWISRNLGDKKLPRSPFVRPYVHLLVGGAARRQA
jgi:hypothetical protein